MAFLAKGSARRGPSRRADGSSASHPLGQRAPLRAVLRVSRAEAKADWFLFKSQALLYVKKLIEF